MARLSQSRRRLLVSTEPTSQLPSPESGAADPPPSGSPSRRRAWLTWGFAVLTFLVGLPAFHHVVSERADRFNNEDTRLLDRFADDAQTHVVFHYDQHVYLNTGRLMKRAGYDYVVPRHRMPGYPLLLSLFYDDSDAYPIDPSGNDRRKVSAAYFERAKQFNLWLTMGLVVVLFVFFTRYLPVPESLLITWSIAWLIFLFKAPYVQPEILFISLSLMLIILMWRQLAEPTWTRGIIAGALFAAAYYIKSALLPLDALYLVCLGLTVVIVARRGRQDQGAGETSERPAWLIHLGKGLLVPVVGFALLSPYLFQTWQLHGTPFWSVHSAHYYWLESVDEKKRWKGLAEQAMEGTVPEDAPSARRYFAEHTAGEIVTRFIEGTRATQKGIRRDYPETERFVFRRLGRTCLVIGILFLVPVALSARRRIPELLFLSGFLVGYALLYGWYNPIRAGLRFMLSLYPVAIALGFWFLARFAGTLKIPRLGFQVHTRPFVLLALAISLGVSIHAILTDLAWRIEGGS